jgi:hypothetical protein
MNSQRSEIFHRHGSKPNSTLHLNKCSPQEAQASDHTTHIQNIAQCHIPEATQKPSKSTLMSTCQKLANFINIG